MMFPALKFPALAALLLATAPMAATAQPAVAQPLAAAPASVPMPLTAAAAQPATPALAQQQVQAAAEQRIAGLKAQLGVTPAQLPQWNAFAQVMRDNAQMTDTLFRQRATTAASMNAVTNMQSYAQISRTYADGIEKLTAAFQAVYDTLSEQQRQAADMLFRQQAAQANQVAPVAKAK